MTGCARQFASHLSRESLRLVVLYGLLAPVLLLHAQRPVAAPAPETAFTVPEDAHGLATLHVYANLIQMPALVLSPDHDSLPPIKPERFSLTLDGGPPYRPTKVRQEGEDPISLAILLDRNGAQTLLPKLDAAIANLAPIGLTAKDHVTIYAVHCGLLKTLDDKPAHSATLRQAAVVALESFAKPVRGAEKNSAACARPLHLWDSIAAAAIDLKEPPGRRVIVAITDGDDQGSKQTWQQVADSLQGKAITLFGLRAEQPMARRPFMRANVAMSDGGTLEVSSFDEFSALCERTGGVVLTTDHQGMAHQLARIPKLIRGRYILEFPRPGNSTAGHHLIEVQVAKSGDFIRVSGISVPLADPRIAADPTTLPSSDPAPGPQIGKRKTMPPP